MKELKQKKSCVLEMLIVTATFTLINSLYASTVQYEYDDLNRLTRAIYDDTMVIEYTYDEVGNRTRRVSTLIADTAVDGAVDFHDFAIVASRWLDQECGYADEWCQRADIDWSGDVGLLDVQILTGSWLMSQGSEPQITGWQIAGTHGLVEFRCDIEDGYIEPRTNGISKLVICFDQLMNTSVTDTNAISIRGETGGPQASPSSITWDGNSRMVITLPSSLPDEDIYTITVGTELQSQKGWPLEGDREIRIIALKGDVNGNQVVNAQDMLAVKAHVNEFVSDSNAKYDVNCNGAINAQDILTVHANVGHSIAQSP